VQTLARNHFTLDKICYIALPTEPEKGFPRAYKEKLSNRPREKVANNTRVAVYPSTSDSPALLAALQAMTAS
jgi:hypothetical protein